MLDARRYLDAPGDGKFTVEEDRLQIARVLLGFMKGLRWEFKRGPPAGFRVGRAAVPALIKVQRGVYRAVLGF